MIGENCLIYHSYIRDFSSLMININIADNVDMIMQETLSHMYVISSIRLSEFAEKILDCYFTPEKYWYIRHKGIEQLNPVEWRRRNLLGDSWYEKLKSEINSDFMQKLGTRISLERRERKIYPNPDRVFRAFNLCSFEHTKIIIVGQNPYPQPNTADGLAFSYLNGIRQGKLQALDIIFEEIEADVYSGFNVNKDYNLKYLADQGVFLINSSLTVKYGDSNSHLDYGWQWFIRQAIGKLLVDNEPKVVLAWGNVAQELVDKVLQKVSPNHPHLILKAKHPAYDVRLRNNDSNNYKPNCPSTFRGCKHFSKANEFLELHNRKSITWMYAER